MIIGQPVGKFRSREEYSQRCKKEIDKFRAGVKVLGWSYVYKHDRYFQALNGDTKQMDLVHEKRGPRIGVVAAFITKEGELHLGASKCDVRTDSFDRYIGVLKALQSALPASWYTGAYDNSNVIPHS